MNMFFLLICLGRCPKNTAKEPKKAPRGSEEHTKADQKIPKARPETSLDQNNRICKPVGGFCELVGIREAPEGLPSHDPRDIYRFQSPKTFPRVPQVTIYRPCRRSMARNVLAFEFGVIGLRCRSICLHFKAMFGAPVRALEARSRYFSSFA